MNPSNPKVFVKQKNRAFIYIYDFKEGDGTIVLYLDSASSNLRLLPGLIATVILLAYSSSALGTKKKYKNSVRGGTNNLCFFVP
jgi:hypothetical protein